MWKSAPHRLVWTSLRRRGRGRRITPRTVYTKPRNTGAIISVCLPRQMWLTAATPLVWVVHASVRSTTVWRSWHRSGDAERRPFPAGTCRSLRRGCANRQVVPVNVCMFRPTCRVRSQSTTRQKVKWRRQTGQTSLWACRDGSSYAIPASTGYNRCSRSASVRCFARRARVRTLATTKANDFRCRRPS
jgi:hypothetical protein